MEQGSAGLFALLLSFLLSSFLFFSFLRGFASISGEQARARLTRARIQRSSLVFHLSSEVMSQKVTKEVRQDSACPPPTRLACLCRPAVDGHTACVHVNKRALCGETMALRTHVRSDLETLPCAGAPPFRSATHHQVHRNNCTNTNKRSFGRARVFPSAVIAWMVYTYTQVISSGVGVRWEAFLTLSSRLHSLSLQRCRGHSKLESIVASSDAAEKHCACTRGSQASAGGAGRAPLASRSISRFIETGEASWHQPFSRQLPHPRPLQPGPPQFQTKAWRSPVHQ